MENGLSPHDLSDLSNIYLIFMKNMMFHIYSISMLVYWRTHGRTTGNVSI